MPETRSLTFSREGDVRVLLQELCAGPGTLACANALVPAGETLLSGEPVTTITGGGERVLELNLRGAALEAAANAGVETWQVCGALTMTLGSFLPELDAVRLSVDGEPLSEAWRDGEALSFADGMMRRKDFSAFLGSAVQLYLADAETPWFRARWPFRRQRAFAARVAGSAHFRGNRRLAGRLCPVPAQLSETDILGVQIEDGVASVNLSSRFYAACQSLDEAQERTAVYAIVNTLCGLTGVDGVRFLFEGESVETLSENIYMRSVLLPNPGAAVTG